MDKRTQDHVWGRLRVALRAAGSRLEAGDFMLMDWVRLDWDPAGDLCFKHAIQRRGVYLRRDGVLERLERLDEPRA